MDRVLFGLLLVRGITASHQLYQGDVCSTDGSKCEKLVNCPLLQENLHLGKRPPLCGFNVSEPIVCCTDDLADRFGESAKPISAHMCTKYEEESCAVSKTYEELTFMARIGYGTKKNINWLCTGTLISRRYILSAAHCAETDRGEAVWASLGQRNPEGPTLYTIVVSFINREYKPPALYNDIALYRLDRVVEFGKYIRPICLPQGFVGDFDQLDTATSSGWTITENGAEFSSDTIALVSSYRCSFAGSAEELPGGSKENIICAAQLSPGSHCSRAEFGGVLLSPRIPSSNDCSLDTQMGLLSVGKHCGVAEYPGVYLNISHFMPWIESVVWPENSTFTEIIWKN